MLIRLIVGVVAGGVLGFSWHKLVGCSTGACPLTANPWIGTIFGIAIGVLMATSIQ